MISVALATYNGEKFILDQLRSIDTCLTVFDEVVVSDDGSVDNTLSLLDQFRSSNFKVLMGPRNGLIFNFENALKECLGDYIFLSDQDDVWTSDKVKVMRRELENGALLVVSDCEVVDADGHTLSNSFFELNGSGPGLLKNLIKNSYLGCAMAFRRELLDYALPFPDDIPMHDWWLGLVAEAKGRTVFLPDKLIKYRRHGNNASSTAEKSKSSFYTKLKYRYALVKNLIKRFYVKRVNNG